MAKILIVDDEVEIRLLLSDAFRLEYHIDDITTAADGLDAYHLCQLHKFDLICLDHMMPYFKGADFLTALRNKEGINKDTPVIMISAYIPDISDTHKTSHHTLFLEKPVDPDRLKRYVKISLVNS